MMTQTAETASKPSQNEEQTEAIIVIREAVIELAEIMLTHTDPNRVRRLIERMKAINSENC